MFDKCIIRIIDSLTVSIKLKKICYQTENWNECQNSKFKKWEWKIRVYTNKKYGVSKDRTNFTKGYSTPLSIC